MAFDIVFLRSYDLSSPKTYRYNDTAKQKDPIILIHNGLGNVINIANMKLVADNGREAQAYRDIAKNIFAFIGIFGE